VCRVYDEGGVLLATAKAVLTEVALLRALEQRNPRFTFVPTMSQAGPSGSPWHGETGHIDQALIGRYLERTGDVAGFARKPVYYIAGPPPMVAALHAMLNTAGADDDDLRTEDFVGY